MAAAYGQRALLTLTSVANLLTGQVYENIPEDSLIEIGLTQSATGLIAGIACDSDIVLQDIGESNILVKTTAPIYPDDFNFNFVCVGGSRLFIAIRNPTAGTLTVFYGVRINPV
jgi:hypothetical protein